MSEFRGIRQMPQSLWRATGYKHVGGGASNHLLSSKHRRDFTMSKPFRQKEFAEHCASLICYCKTAIKALGKKERKLKTRPAQVHVQTGCFLSVSCRTRPRTGSRKASRKPRLVTGSRTWRYNPFPWHNPTLTGLKDSWHGVKASESVCFAQRNQCEREIILAINVNAQYFHE